MSIVVMELYQALRSAGVTEEQASAAAGAVLGDLATKSDLRALGVVFKSDLAELKSDMIKWNVGAIVAMAAIVAAIVKL